LRTNQKKLNRNKNVDTTQEINTVEWFFGYGGNHIGLKRCLPNLRLKSVCEIEEFAIENILAKMENGLLEAAPIWSNCKTFPTEPFVDRVDLFIASYPCQPFSSAGKRQGEDDERHLWPSVYMWIRATRPLCVFLENVEGHVSLGLSTVISDLEEGGYSVAWGIFSARECLDGNNETATHQRKRVFIMAHLKNFGLEIDNGSKIQCETSGRWTLQPCGIRPHIVRELENTCDQRLPRSLAIEDKQDKCRGEEHCYPTKGDGTTILWPSRPGQPQHQWEPPRIVAHSNSSEQSAERGDDGEMPKVSSEQWSDQCASLFRGEGHADNAGTINKTMAYIKHQREDGTAREMGSEKCPNEDKKPKPWDFTQTTWNESSGGGSYAYQCNEAQPEVGGNIDGTTIGVDLPSMSSISDSELVEILDWMVKGESRVDELRLLGNGVFPSTSEKAFRTLFKELIER
jgi:site-specific DNA-cytosine methylase